MKLASKSPLTAVKYQLSVMLGVMRTVSITVLIFLHLVYKVFFKDRNQFLLTKRDLPKDEIPVNYD